VAGAKPRVERGNQRIVGQQLLRSEHMPGQPIPQRLQPARRTADPVSQRRPVQLDALPGEVLGLPVEGKVIAVLVDQHLSQQAGRRQPPGDRPLQCRSAGATVPRCHAEIPCLARDVRC
jgi:hypothetical protein